MARVERVIRDIPTTVAKIADALGSKLTFQENFRAKHLGPIVTPVGANTEFTVTHDLGALPSGYIVTKDANATVYDSNRSAWTTSQLFLKCSGSAVTIYLTVY